MNYIVTQYSSQGEQLGQWILHAENEEHAQEMAHDYAAFEQGSYFEAVKQINK